MQIIEKQPGTNRPKLLFLDGLRGIAALYVMMGHARWLLWEGYQAFTAHPEKYSLFDKFLVYFFSLFKWGHEFVLLFFVLSGFVIHYGYALKLKQNSSAKIQWGQYLLRRARRIYPPFLFAVLLTLILDTIGRANGLAIYDGQTPYQSINTNVGNQNLEWQTLAGNLFFLYKEYVPLFGTNGPTWSLKFEWWFYMIYPLMILVARKHIYYATGLMVVLFAASFFPFLWPEALSCEIFGSMICWWLGVILAEVATGRITMPMPVMAGLAILGFGVCFIISGDSRVTDLKTAFLFTAIIATLLAAARRGKSLKWLEKLKPLGDFSYTLYIIHFPILVLLSGLIMRYRSNSLPAHSYFIMLGIVICLAVAYVAHFLVERPFMKTKTEDMKRLQVKPKLKLVKAKRKNLEQE
ncbi:MAG: acyltransferase [Chitinophagaceae bacterium]|nr:MAG: acyltransferase [Chitinophagaceae bacterium]